MQVFGLPCSTGPLGFPIKVCDTTFLMELWFWSVFGYFIFIQPPCRTFAIVEKNPFFVTSNNMVQKCPVFCHDNRKQQVLRQCVIMCSFNSFGTKLSSFYTLPICFRWSNTERNETLNLSTKAHVI